ncbi:5-pentadecatrienyl resorcinol O-methyltransferase-like [Panicum miliaceum]|uniref:5-pentadecatrienyl resorcinol O-methyltransferase-like n=1 Tax=Panicum miliaceum TaxID=4540 RepID=A0A3L6TSK2_PANMI|nr:5-pentadecatrienyl resorcinol O-methyltransferase-like [Panicum miliaceum]
MALSEESKDLLQAQVELWKQTFSFMKSVALAVALDLRIADAIRHHGGAATLPQILSGTGINPCRHDKPVYKLTTVCRLLTSDDDGETSAASCLSPMWSHVLNPFHDSVLSMGLASWFRHEEPGKCPYALMRGATVWEMCGSSDALNASINNAMAADSRFLMRIVVEECGGIFRGIDSLVDVADGVGGAAAAIAAVFPSLKCSVLDLPHVVANAPSVSNVQFVAGDMFVSIPPANAIFLKYVLHDWGDDKCIKLLKNCKQAIPSRDACGKVIIIDIVVGSSPSDVKLLETQVLCDLHIMKIGGVEGDEQEWKKIFLAAGFKDYNIMPIGLRSLIELYP